MINELRSEKPRECCLAHVKQVGTVFAKGQTLKILGFEAHTLGPVAQTPLCHGNTKARVINKCVYLCPCETSIKTHVLDTYSSWLIFLLFRLGNLTYLFEKNF